MPIHPLPQFEADVKAMLDEEDRRTYEALKAPKTMVVRFGAMKLVGEYPYSGDAKPGCGSKIVCRTHRGTEVGEMLTSTCPNSGCSKSVSRKDMLGYIQNSGGRDYPFFTEGRVLRVATMEDLDRQASIEQSRHGLKLEARSIAERLGVHAKIVDAEPILGGEVLTFYYLSEERLDLRDLQQALSDHFKHRIDLRQVGARDEARLTADYEKCGQYCCCKNFLKVLKPVSMKSAKVQKATLDPLKISGRCGRLMCCLRYEDQTYDELKKRLPRKKSRVGTPEGDGMVLEGQILTQLVLVELDEIGSDGKIRHVAIPVEDLTEPTNPKAPVRDPALSAGRPGGGRPSISRGPARPRPATAPGDQPPAGERPAEGAGERGRGRPGERHSERGEPRADQRGGTGGDQRGGEGGRDQARPARQPRGDRPDSGDRPRQSRPPRVEPGERSDSGAAERAPSDRDISERSDEGDSQGGGPREAGPREGGPRPGGKRRRRGKPRSPEARGGGPAGDRTRGDQTRDGGARDGQARDGQPRGEGGPPSGDATDGGGRKRRRRRRGRGRGPDGGGSGGGSGGEGGGGSPGGPSNS